MRWSIFFSLGTIIAGVMYCNPQVFMFSMCHKSGLFCLCEGSQYGNNWTYDISQVGKSDNLRQIANMKESQVVIHSANDKYAKGEKNT